MIIQEIVNKDKITKKYKSGDAHIKEYCKHIGYGSSGVFNDKTNIGTIWSHRRVCKALEKKGYKNLHFCNGGDDDVLIIDHDKKQFGFLEYGDLMEIGMEVFP